jgi:hypothetical protein
MAVPIFKNYTGLIYTAQNGAFDFSERIYYTEELQGTVEDARSYADTHPRGALWTIIGLSGVFCVEQTGVSGSRGGIGTVTVKYVWLNSVPPDEWSVTPFEISPPIERANYFSALTLNDLKLAKGSFVSDQMTGQATLDNASAASPNATLIQSLITKWLRGEETFYVAGLKYQWTAYFTTLSGVTFRRGGYVETPGGPGAYPANFTWLRQSDEIVWNNGMYRLTRTWIGAPSSIGLWDSDLYGGGAI